MNVLGRSSCHHVIVIIFINDLAEYFFQYIFIFFLVFLWLFLTFASFILTSKKILFIYPQKKEEKKRELTNDERIPATGRLEVVTFARDSAG